MIDGVTLPADSQTPRTPVEKMTVQQLRNKLQKKNLSTVGKKKVLLDKLQKAIENDVDNTELDLEDEINPTNNDSEGEEINNQIAARQVRGLRQRSPLPPERTERR